MGQNRSIYRYHIAYAHLITAVGVGSGSESQAPMAIAVIGGLITSTLLTLIVIPVVYPLFDDLKSKSNQNNPENRRTLRF